jgi:hypothetical protein
MQAGRELFGALLDELRAELRHDTTHKWLAERCAADPRFHALDTSQRVGAPGDAVVAGRLGADPGVRADMLKRAIAPLVEAEEERVQQERSRLRREFRDALVEAKLERRDTWTAVRRLCSVQPACCAHGMCVRSGLGAAGQRPAGRGAVGERAAGRLSRAHGRAARPGRGRAVPLPRAECAMHTPR